MTDSDDSGSRRRPPRAGQFQPGCSGNPRGRPKGSKNLATHVQGELDVKVPVVERGRQRLISKGEIIARQLVNGAAKGDGKSIQTIVNMTRDTGRKTPAVDESVLARDTDQEVIKSIMFRIRTSTPPAEDITDADPDQTSEAAPSDEPNHSDETGDV